jgi:hypothetical protein
MSMDMADRYAESTMGSLLVVSLLGLIFIVLLIAYLVKNKEKDD